MPFGYGESTNSRKAVRKAARRLAEPMAEAGKRPQGIRVDITPVGKRYYKALAKAPSRRHPN